MKEKKKVWLALGIVLFLGYFLCAARPVPPETVLVPRWLASLEYGSPVALGEASIPEPDTGETAAQAVPLIPFELGSRFGYFDPEGRFSVNQVMKSHVSLSVERWAEYDAEPESITVKSGGGEELAVINTPRGYPFFLDGRTFLIGSEQNTITEIDDDGDGMWTYEFASPLTCIDAAAGLVLAGSLDGVALVLDNSGRQVFSFEPGGSRYSIIAGCALSRDGSRLALVSGIDDQRFLLLEKFGTSSADYKVVYHEFLNSDFRRAVYITFVEDDRWVIFERSGGIGFFEVGSRQAGKIELDGDIAAIDTRGGQGLVFAVLAQAGTVKELVGVRLPAKVILQAPFRSADVFLERRDSRLFVGGKQTLVSYDVDKR